MQHWSVMFRLLVLTVALTSCAPQRAPISLVAGMADTTATAVSKAGRSHDAVAAALGLPPLSTTPLPDGHEEVRIWYASSGVPEHLTRLVKRGSKVEGFHAMHWDTRPTPHEPPGYVNLDSILRFAFAGACGPVRRTGDFEACLTRYTREPDWKAIWNDVAMVPAWSIPDQASLGPRDIVADGWGMVVELRAGQRYRAFSYSNARRDGHLAERQALALLRATDPASKNWRPMTHLKTYRGRLDVRVGADPMFTPCNSAVRWLWLGDLPAALVPRPGPDTSTVASHLVELVGMLGTPGWAKEFFGPPDDVIEVRRVLRWSPWTEKTCRVGPFSKPVVWTNHGE